MIFFSSVLIGNVEKFSIGTNGEVVNKMFFSDLNALVLIVNQCTLHYMYIIEIKLKKN